MTKRQTRPEDATGDSGLSGLLADLAALAEGRERVSLDALLATIGTRGFGPPIVVLALLLILPVGMVPGMPGAVALTLAAIAVQLGLGRRCLRPPRRLREARIAARHLRAVIGRLRPLARRSERVLRPRLPRLTASRLAALTLAAALLATAAVVFVLGFIPGLPFMLAWPLLLIGLGLTARDGLAVAIGLALYLPAGLVLIRVIGAAQAG
ncbi:MAG: exopolysaccharide biosynthesis protein [Rhodobacteraceae bacterium]|nr:exopolysaccharide biosynthesis protein [Paracoccaceae bacterium]